MAGAIRDAVRAINPDMPVFSVRSMEAFYDARAMLGPRLTMQMVTATGLMGLLLAVIGLYGVVAYAVSRRTREIGIRMAIGARPGDVLRMILSQGMMFTAIGVGAGLVHGVLRQPRGFGFRDGREPSRSGDFPERSGHSRRGDGRGVLAAGAARGRIDPTLALRQE